MNPKIQDLPIAPYLETICHTLKASPSRFLVLTAQTAAGKSTAVPLALLENFSGKILMLEPRRLAAVALADRISDLLGEKTGQTAGYTLSLESKTSARTRFEVITEAILTRRLQNDPLLEDTNVIILDEFHERSVHSDLALAFLKETMALRSDLFVIIMSATMDTKRIAEYLSTPPAPVLDIPGRQFPVQIEYKDKTSVTDAVLRELKNSQAAMPAADFRTDSILVFLPGIYEISKTKTELESAFSQNISENEAEICILHSSVPLSEQKKILSPVPLSSPRRIILSSAIAETSLTVPGVTTVIDSGLARVNKMNVSLGMESLVTEKISRFSADQRSGRAGRLMEGRCIRLWNQFDVLKTELSPEILRCNLANLVLECAQWGSTKIDSFDWLDTPPESAWNSNIKLLTGFGFLKDGKITQEGKHALSLGIDVRLACALLYAKKSGHLTEGLNFALKYSQHKNLNETQKSQFFTTMKNRLSKCTFTQSVDFSSTELLLAGFPDRLAQKLLHTEQDAQNRTIYQFASGRKAYLEQSPQNAPEWLIAPEVNAGSTTGKIYSYEKAEPASLELWLNSHAKTSTVTTFEENSFALKKTEITAFGAIILKQKKLAASQNDFGQALCNELKTNGFKRIPFNKKIMDFLLRAQFYAVHKENSLFDKIENLQNTARDWLLPFITSAKIDEETVFNALWYFLDGTKIDSSVPSVLILPNGKKAKILYEARNYADTLTPDIFTANARTLNVIPVLEIIIQQIFGCFSTPEILDVPVLLKLLSPARRPLQITDDLENFWQNAWIEICKEMKGRYPKHNWDYRQPCEN